MRTMKTKRYRYQIQFACFDCRKAFKRPYTVGEQERAAWLSHRLSGKQPSKGFTLPNFLCPDCGRNLTLVGRAFRALRHGNLDGWRKVEFLVCSGFTFWSGLGRYPKTLTEAQKFVEKHRKTSSGQKLAARFRNRWGKAVR
jgi:hypothetical protein